MAQQKPDKTGQKPQDHGDVSAIKYKKEMPFR
jgi:hypothetical protein